MRIFIADLGYLSPTEYEHTVPLGAGLLAANALNHFPDLKIEIFKDPNELITAVSLAPPSLLAFSHYMWNQNLNYAVIKRCKSYAPELPVIMGGPNFSPEDKEWTIDFFKKRSLLDFYITGEGEKSFLKLIELLSNNGCDPNKLNVADWPSTFLKYDHNRNELLNNHKKTIDPVDLLGTPSPYLTGILDSFLKNEHFVPIIETNRGCPYDCAFCNWGRGMSSKLRQYDCSRVIEEIEYVAEHSVNPTKVLYLADANFGLLKRDRKIAEAINQAKEKHQFPRQLYVYAAKVPTKHTMDAFEILKSSTEMSVSMQSTNEKALLNISRNNLDLKAYKTILNECKNRGIETYSEVIFGLPGENFESFVNGIAKLLRHGQERIAIYALRLHWGTKINTSEYRELHGLKTAYRIHIVPTNREDENGFNTIEHTEIVVGTNDITTDDFFRYRDFHVLISLLSSRVFTEFRRGLRILHYEIASISKMILDDEKNWPPNWKQNMQDYREKCRSELIAPEDVKEEVTEEEIAKLNNIEILLAPSFLCKFFARSENVQEFEEYLNEFLHRSYCKDITGSQMADLCLTLRISIDRAICYDQFRLSHYISYDYDIDAWLSSKQLLPLSEFNVNKTINYMLEPHEGIAEAFKKARQVSISLENSVYLLKYKFFLAADDKVFYYLRNKRT